MFTIPFESVRLLSRIDRRLAGVSRQYFRSHSDSDDLRQEIFLLVWQRTAEFDPKRASLATFQERIIENAVENFLMRNRWQKNQPVESLETEPCTNDVPLSALTYAEKTVFAAEIQMVIESLPKRQRQCCELLKHHSLSEAASILGITQRQLQKELTAIRKNFAVFLEK